METAAARNAAKLKGRGRWYFECFAGTDSAAGEPGSESNSGSADFDSTDSTDSAPDHRADRRASSRRSWNDVGFC
jgi:hypothetical protein